MAATPKIHDLIQPKNLEDALIANYPVNFIIDDDSVTNEMACAFINNFYNHHTKFLPPTPFLFQEQKKFESPPDVIQSGIRVCIMKKKKEDIWELAKKKVEKKELPRYRYEVAFKRWDIVVYLVEIDSKNLFFMSPYVFVAIKIWLLRFEIGFKTAINDYESLQNFLEAKIHETYDASTKTFSGKNFQFVQIEDIDFANGYTVDRVNEYDLCFFPFQNTKKVLDIHEYSNLLDKADAANR